MTRTLAERARDWRWWGEQVAHALIGAAIAWGLSWVIPEALAVAIACYVGCLRETYQNWGDPDGSLGDSLADAAAWMAGAAVGGMIPWPG